MSNRNNSSSFLAICQNLTADTSNRFSKTTTHILKKVAGHASFTETDIQAMFPTLGMEDNNVVTVMLLCVSESRQQSVSQAGAAVQAELEEERRRYQGLLREFTRLEQRYDNLRDMSMLSTAEVLLLQGNRKREKNSCKKLSNEKMHHKK